MPAGNPLSGQGGNANIIFRIPTPMFGAGLVEAIPDSAILANMKANAPLKAGLGISGHANAHLSGNVNISANDGTITRFGWKAQNKSLLMFGRRHTTSRWGSRIYFSRKSGTRLPAAFSNATPADTELHACRHTAFQSKYSRPLRYRGVCRFHANAGAARPSAGHNVHREWTGSFHKHWLRSLSHAIIHHR